MSLAFCVKGCSKLGDQDGKQSCPVQLPRRSRGRFWKCAQRWARMVDTPASHDVLRDFQGPAEWLSAFVFISDGVFS